MTCPVCSSPYAIILGTLGLLKWLRCRDCGIDYSVRLSKRRARVLNGDTVIEA